MRQGRRSSPRVKLKSQRHRARGVRRGGRVRDARVVWGFGDRIYLYMIPYMI